MLVDNQIKFGLATGPWVTTKSTTLQGFTTAFAARFKGKLDAPSDGTYQFTLQAEDGAVLYINSAEIVNHDNEHSYTSVSNTVSLDKGLNDIEVHYFKGGSGTHGLELRWIPPGETVETVIPPEKFFHAEANEYCDDENVPKIFNLAVEFETENGEKVKLNLT